MRTKPTNRGCRPRSADIAVAGGLLCLGFVAGANAQSWSYTRIADTSTTIPGTPFQFQVFGVPSIENGVVGLTGSRITPAQVPAGVYTGAGGPLSIVADNMTAVPGGGGTFTGFGQFLGSWPSSSAGSVAFHGQIGGGVNAAGIYLRDGAQLLKVVDYLTPVPNGTGGNFFPIGQPSLENGRVAFVASEFGGAQRGVYSWQGGALSIIADRNTPIPSGPGAFTDFFDCDLSQGQIVFSAEGTGLHRGIYSSDTGGSLSRLYDTTMVVPGGNGGNFTGFAQTVLNDGRVAFYGQGGGQEGVYTDITGALEVIANHNTPVPGLAGTFGGFGFVSIDEGVIAFTGLHSGALLGVFSTHGGTLQKVLAFGDLLDGRIVEDAFIGGQALDGDSIAMKVLFTDGTQGIYMATIPAPATLAVAVPVAMAASRRRRQAQCTNENEARRSASPVAVLRSAR